MVRSIYCECPFTRNRFRSSSNLTSLRNATDFTLGCNFRASLLSMGGLFYVGTSGGLGKLSNIRVETNLAMVYYLHSKTGLYSLWLKPSFNRQLSHFLALVKRSRKRYPASRFGGEHYTLPRRANKFQRVKETRGMSHGHRTR